MTQTLEAKTREVSKKARQILREGGMVPAVLYGKKETATNIAVSARDFKKTYEEAGESTVVTLTGLDGNKEVLIQEVVVDPILGGPIHIDFLAIEANKPVVVSVELEFEGVAEAEKTLGGTLMKVMHEIEIEALPKNLPHAISVDISSLVTFEDQILAKDIRLPSGVTLITDEEEVVALVSEASEEPEEEVEAPDLSAIEVEKKGKADTEEIGTEEEK